MIKQLYDGRYIVSDEGRVFSRVKNYSKQVELKGKISKTTGYRMIILYPEKHGKRIYVNVHRLIAEYFIENPENKSEVNHIDGNKINNRANNLEWTTTSENQIHCRDKLKVSSHKLDMGRANQVRKLYKSGNYSQRQLAKIFNVGKTIIGQIILNQRWKSHT